MRLFEAGLRKLIRRPATYITFGLLVGLLALIMLAVGATARQQTGAGSQQALLLVTFPGAYSIIVSFILGLGGLFAMTYGGRDRRIRVDLGHAQGRRGAGRERAVATSCSTSRRSPCWWGSASCSRSLIGVLVALIGAGLAGVSTIGRDRLDHARQAARAAPSWLARRRSRPAPSGSRSPPWPAASWPGWASGSASISANSSRRSSCPTS